MDEAETTSYGGTTGAWKLNYHAESQSDRLMRLSNQVADAFAHAAAEFGVAIAGYAEAADALAEFARIVERIERLGLVGGLQ